MREPQPGSVGVVIGATLAEVPDLSGLGGPVLVPGIGAQGGRPEALAGLGGYPAGSDLLPDGVPPEIAAGLAPEGCPKCGSAGERMRRDSTGVSEPG